MWRRRAVVGAGLSVAALVAVWATVAALGDTPKRQCATARSRHVAGSPPVPWHGLGAGRAELDLTEQQRDSLREIAESHRGELLALRERTRTQRRELQDMIASGETDEAALRAKAAQMAEAMADGAVLAARIARESRPVFTEAQLRKLTKMRDDRRQSVDRWLEDTARRAGTKDAG